MQQHTAGDRNQGQPPKKFRSILPKSEGLYSSHSTEEPDQWSQAEKEKAVPLQSGPSKDKGVAHPLPRVSSHPSGSSSLRPDPKGSFTQGLSTKAITTHDMYPQDMSFHDMSTQGAYQHDASLRGLCSQYLYPLHDHQLTRLESRLVPHIWPM